MKLTIDIKDLWQDFKEALKLTYSLWTDPKIAPPMHTYYRRCIYHPF